VQAGSDEHRDREAEGLGASRDLSLSMYVCMYVYLSMYIKLWGRTAGQDGGAGPYP
jgi:hypothetical protein